MIKKFLSVFGSLIQNGRLDFTNQITKLIVTLSVESGGSVGVAMGTPTRGNVKVYIFSTSFLSIEFYHSTRNASRTGLTVRNGSVLVITKS